MTTRVTGRLLVLLAAAAVWILPAAALQNAASLDDVLNATSFRNIGPFRTSAWVTEIAVPETPARDHLYTIYAATRTGGLWKTSNNGVTWDPISDSVEVAAVGAVALAPSNPSIVWMGTGDQANARSSVLRQGHLQVHRRRQDAGSRWACWTRTTSPASSSTRPIPRLSTLQRWATCSRRTKSAACSGRATVEKPGTRCCMWTTAPAPSTL